MFKLTTVVSAALMTCAGNFASAQANLTGETAPATQLVAQVMFGVAELAANAGIANIQIAAGQTLTNSVQNVAEGKTDIASAPFILPFLLSRGAGPYASIGPDDGAELTANLSVLYTYRLSVTGLVTYESSDFDGWDSVPGSRIYNGPPRGAALNKARAMIRLVTGLNDGEGYEGVQVNWGQAVATITDGSADAFMLPMNFPDARYSQTASSGKMVVHSFPKDVFESEAGVNYGKAPGTASVITLSSNELIGPNIRVESEDEYFRGYAELGGDVVNIAMDEELAYQLTKTFIEGLDAIQARTPSMPNGWLGKTDLSFTGMCGVNPLRYHPGAVRAWEEAGYELPDCAKP